MNDPEILRLFRERDESALVETDRKYGMPLLKLGIRILGSAEDAEENRNDVYMKAWIHIPDLQPQHLEAWLMTVCRNLAFNRLKMKNSLKRHAVLVELTKELADCIPDPRSIPGPPDLLSCYISNFLREQPREERNMLLRRYWKMESIRDIASFYNCSPNRVKGILFRMRRKLAEYLKERNRQDETQRDSDGTAGII